MISQLEKEITLKYLKTRKNDGFLNIISIFSFIGISLGVAVLIIVMSVMNGFRTELVEKIIGFNAHSVIKPYETSIDEELFNDKRINNLSEKFVYSNSGEGVLINKDYTKIYGLNSLQNVIVFFPSDNLLAFTIKNDKSLFSSALENNFILAGPRTLMSMIKVLEQIRSEKKQIEGMKKMQSSATNIFEKYVGLKDAVRQTLSTYRTHGKKLHEVMVKSWGQQGLEKEIKKLKRSVDLTSTKYVKIINVAAIIKKLLLKKNIKIKIMPSKLKDSVQLNKKNKADNYLFKFWKPKYSLEEGISKIIDNYI